MLRKQFFILLLSSLDKLLRALICVIMFVLYFVEARVYSISLLLIFKGRTLFTQKSPILGSMANGPVF